MSDLASKEKDILLIKIGNHIRLLREQKKSLRRIWLPFAILRKQI